MSPNEVGGGEPGDVQEPIRAAAAGERGEGAAEAERVSEPSAHARTHLTPPTVSEEVQENHLLTGHAQFRNWCGHCLAIRARADGHPHTKEPDDRLPEIAFDDA